MKRQKLIAFILGLCLILGITMGPWGTGTAQGSESDGNTNGEVEEILHDLDWHEDIPDFHIFSEEWSKNENGHWHDMICAHSTEYIPEALTHEYSEDIICNVCGYEQVNVEDEVNVNPLMLSSVEDGGIYRYNGFGSLLVGNAQFEIFDEYEATHSRLKIWEPDYTAKVGKLFVFINENDIIPFSNIEKIDVIFMSNDGKRVKIFSVNTHVTQEELIGTFEWIEGDVYLSPGDAMGYMERYTLCEVDIYDYWGGKFIFDATYDNVYDNDVENFTVVNKNSGIDVDGPILENMILSDHFVERNGTLTVKIYASDIGENASGLKEASIHFVGKGEDDSENEWTLVGGRSDGIFIDENGKTYFLIEFSTEHVLSGFCELDLLGLTDNEGNSRYYGQSDLDNPDFGFTVVDSHIHTYESKWTYNETKHWHASTCGHADYGKDVGNHVFSSWYIRIPETNTTWGEKERKCTVCSYKETAVIPPTGSNTHNHIFSSWVTITAPTATTTGLQERYCQGCNYKEANVIPATGTPVFAPNPPVYYPANNVILDKINSSPNDSRIIVPVTRSDMMPAEAFDAIRGVNKTLELLLPNGASWSFNGLNIPGISKNIALDIQTSLLSNSADNVGQLVSILVNGAETVIIRFPENGVLPGMATIKIPLTNAMIAELGTSGIAAYYVNESLGTLDLAAADISVINGSYVEFLIWHNSTYILTRGLIGSTNTSPPTNNQNNVFNPDNGMPIIQTNTNFPTDTDLFTNTNSTSDTEASSDAVLTTNTDLSTNTELSTNYTQPGDSVARAPRTGEENSYYLWLTMMIVGIVLFVITVIIYYRNESNAFQIKKRHVEIKTAKEAGRFLEEFFR